MADMPDEVAMQAFGALERRQALLEYASPWGW